jgi:hypothetical protein
VPVADELIKMLQELENSPSSDADVSGLLVLFVEELLVSDLGTRENRRIADRSERFESLEESS